MSKEKTMSIIAEALVYNRKFAKNQISAKTLGFEEFHNWRNAMESAMYEAYRVAVYRYKHMGDAEAMQDCDQTALYTAIRAIIAQIGEVNGDTLNPANIAEAFIAEALRFKKIDISNDMAHARCEKLSAKKRNDANNTEENQANFDHWEAEVKRLESLPGNCKLQPTIQSDATFTKVMQAKLGDAIMKQEARPLEDILAEKAARKAARDAKRKANKQAKQANK